MVENGKLVRWNYKKGFGFIRCEQSNDDVFIHISALKHMVRKPNVGDVIYFERVVDKDGKPRAVSATIKGVATKSVGGVTSNVSKHKITTLNWALIILALMAIFYLYQTFSPNPLPMPQQLKTWLKKEDFSKFTCQGKQHCSQMVSCKEARFYLQNCPNVKIDGDGDGVPCEKQWCR